MDKRISEYFIKGRRHKIEFKKQARMLIVVTLGFTIAFTWRQTIFDVSQSFVNLFLKIQNSSELSIITSSFITLISTILIYFTSYLLRENPEERQIYHN